MDSNSCFSTSVFTYTTLALKHTQNLDAKKFLWACEFFAYLTNETLTYKKHADYVSWGVQQTLYRCWKDLWHTDNHSFSTQKVHSQDILDWATWIRNVWNSLLCCSPITATDVYPWIGPDSHSMPSWFSVSHNCCLQLLSKRGRDSATQLRGNCHSHAPLAPASPVDEEKCIH